MKCEYCGKTFSNIGIHWSAKPKHYPDMNEEQIKILAGVALGDGHIKVMDSGVGNIDVQMINENYLKHLQEKFPTLGVGVSLYRTAAKKAKQNRDSGFSPKASEENYNDIYRWRTLSHPDIGQLSDPLSKVECNRTTVKHWIVCDGHKETNGQEPRYCIAMSNLSDKKDYVWSWFQNAGFEPYRWAESEIEYNGVKKTNTTLFFDKQTSKNISDWIGKMPSGFERKKI
jgi:hypothetical protein